MITVISNRWVVLAIRIVIGAVFIYAGVRKVGDPQAFADSIATFRLLPVAAINHVALALPWFEIAAGFMLVTGWRWQTAALAIIGLTLLFAIGITSAMVRGIEVDCGCFGNSQTGGAATSLIRDVLILILMSAVYLPGRHVKKLMETPFAN